MGETVDFKSNGGQTRGYVAVPKSGSGPAVVVIQEWWGLVSHIKDVCDRFASEGFGALAPDLYHGEVAKSPDDRSVPPEFVHDLEKQMKSVGKSFEAHIYPGTDHAFFNDTRPEVYNAEASKDAWRRVIEYFRANLK